MIHTKEILPTNSYTGDKIITEDKATNIPEEDFM